MAASSVALAASIERLKSLHPRVIDLSLDRVRRLLHRLGNPEAALPPVVHVAGTNGKGSTIAFLKAMLNAHGLSTHVYTSPHLVRFSERIVVGDREIAESDLIDLLAECEEENRGEAVTFFEITTAAALLAFARAHADFTLLETGLGGRLDATNVVPAPAVSVITPISVDHRAFLGDTISCIAGEKAGIIKKGVPVVSARQEAEAAAVIKARAAALGAPVFAEGSAWRVGAENGTFRYVGSGVDWLLPMPSLPGSHQIDNAGVAIFTLSRLMGGMRPEAVSAGLRDATWPARLQRLGAGPLAAVLPPSWELWLDGGHNAGAAQVLARHLEGWRDRPCYLVFGMLQSKDAADFVRILSPKISAAVAVSIPGETTSYPPEDLAHMAAAAGLVASTAPTPRAALERVMRCPGPARVLISGSLYLAGHVLETNGTHP